MYVGVAEVTIFVCFIRETESICASEAWPVTWQLKLLVQILRAMEVDLIEGICTWFTCFRPLFLCVHVLPLWLPAVDCLVLLQGRLQWWVQWVQAVESEMAVEPGETSPFCTVLQPPPCLITASSKLPPAHYMRWTIIHITYKAILFWWISHQWLPSLVML